MADPSKKIDIVLAYPRPTKDSPVKLTPLSVLFPGVYFKSLGMRVEYFDERFDPKEELERLIKDSKEIAVSAMTGFQTGQAAAILMMAKKINPDIVTGVGGHHARILTKEVLDEPFVDKVWPEPVYGEHLFPYDEQTRKHFARTEMQYLSSRGCPYGCRFCALTSVWEPKAIECLEKELTIIHNDIRFKTISFADPNIAHTKGKVDGEWIKVNNVERIRRIGDIMRALDVTWEGNLRSPNLTEEMVEALVYSKCTHIEIGCESGSDRILRNIVRKGHGVDEIKRAVMNVRGSGISLMYSFIAFMPGETIEDVMKTMDLIDWIVETDPDARVSIYNYAPYPGTPMYEDAIRGKHGYTQFVPPKTMMEWGNLKLMTSPLYWITGLNFRMDNTRKNFPGEEWKIIESYVKLAQEKWKKRDILDFPCEEVEGLIEKQVRKFDKEMALREKGTQTIEAATDPV